MRYWITLKQGKFGHKHFFDAVLPGVLFPVRLVPKLRADFADEMLGICEHCTMDCHCHPIGPDGEKYCTILLHDVIRPDWKLSDVL